MAAALPPLLQGGTALLTLQNGLEAERVALDRLDRHDRAVARLVLADDKVGAGVRRHLRQVGDAKDLVAPGDRRHPLPDDAADLSADVGVHLVEDKDRDGVEVGQDRLQGEHHPGQLAA